MSQNAINLNNRVDHILGSTDTDTDKDVGVAAGMRSGIFRNLRTQVQQDTTKKIIYIYIFLIYINH